MTVTALVVDGTWRGTVVTACDVVTRVASKGVELSDRGGALTGIEHLAMQHVNVCGRGYRVWVQKRRPVYDSADVTLALIDLDPADAKRCEVTP